MHINQKIREALFFPTVKDNSDTSVEIYYLKNSPLQWRYKIWYTSYMNGNTEFHTQRKHTKKRYSDWMIETRKKFEAYEVIVRNNLNILFWKEIEPRIKLMSQYFTALFALNQEFLVS